MRGRKKGFKQSEETKRKIGDTLKRKGIKPPKGFGGGKKGQIAWNKGKPAPWAKNLPQKFKKENVLWKNAKRNPRKGEKSHFWKGGISFEPYSVDWTDDLKESIRKRDDYTCQLCGIHQYEISERIHCHHIDYNKKNCNPENLVILCKSCHSKTNYNREYWLKYFTERATF